ncbi:hypothetical protein [Mycobacterium palustre]|uniref:hypothetical protein n=1 Tax=Mycobacterium palustre TaxID=153971 RepID=UPI0013023AFB|nr:hypothetical protein [Mycobacterium palustre]MCV7100957.1 hypothetical protein [Mycobacterium palustre]
MLPGNSDTSPLPLTDRIVIALDQLRIARAAGDTEAEFAWQMRFDTLLDQYSRAGL